MKKICTSIPFPNFACRMGERYKKPKNGKKFYHVIKKWNFVVLPWDPCENNGGCSDICRQHEYNAVCECNGDAAVGLDGKTCCKFFFSFLFKINGDELFLMSSRLFFISDLLCVFGFLSNRPQDTGS